MKKIQNYNVFDYIDYGQIFLMVSPLYLIGYGIRLLKKVLELDDDR